MDQFQKDLRFVRDAVERQEARALPAAIPVLWAGICGVGLTLQDVQPRGASIFWMCAVPSGILLSVVLGSMYSKGQVASPRRDLIQILHWLSIPFAMAILVYIVAMRSEPQVMGAQVILLMVAVVYFLGGLHLNRVWLYGGLTMAAGILLIPVVPAYPFTATGLAVAAALLFGAFANGSRTQKGTVASV